MAVLFGVFLYLGISAMSGVQMFDRTKLLLMPVKHHPSVGYVRRVSSYTTSWNVDFITLGGLCEEGEYLYHVMECRLYHPSVGYVRRVSIYTSSWKYPSVGYVRRVSIYTTSWNVDFITPQWAMWGGWVSIHLPGNTPRWAMWGGWVAIPRHGM